MSLFVASCREVDLRTDKVYRVEVSYMDIYNEGLYDLLADNPAAADNLAIMDDASNTVVRSDAISTATTGAAEQSSSKRCSCAITRAVDVLLPGPAHPRSIDNAAALRASNGHT
jgi:hypothetical protein